MMKRVLFGAVLGLLAVADARAQQYPMLDAVASNIVQRYKQSSCSELMVQRDQPKSAQEQRAVQMLHDDPQMRQEFIRRVAAPIANKLFECHMIP